MATKPVIVRVIINGGELRFVIPEGVTVVVTDYDRHTVKEYDHHPEIDNVDIGDDYDKAPTFLN